MQDPGHLRADLNRTSIEFLKIDLDTALTFTEIAAEAGDNGEKRRRNQNNARRAYDNALRLLGRTTPDKAEERAIHDKLHRLKLALQASGEVF
jgi:hypothetical protein